MENSMSCYGPVTERCVSYPTQNVAQVILLCLFPYNST